MESDSTYDVFSNRITSVSETYIYDVSRTFRNRIFLLLDDVFDIFQKNSKRRHRGGSVSFYKTTFWNEIHRVLLIHFGKMHLSENGAAKSTEADSRDFLQDCGDNYFLDFVELIFKVDFIHRAMAMSDDNSLVEKINDLLVLGNLGYELTDLVVEIIIPQGITKKIAYSDPNFVSIKTLAYPKIVIKDSKVTHAQIIKPVLTLLSNPIFENANIEFLEARDFYRKGNYFDCLGRCGSAFESVMKIVCDEKGWPYDQKKDTAGKLVTIIINNTDLESYLSDPLRIVATLRNRLSKAHGAGSESRYVPQHLARFALNATASMITLIVDETRE